MQKQYIRGSVAICTPAQGQPSWAFLHSLLNMNMPDVYTFMADFTYVGVDMKRNNLVKNALSRGYEWVFFVDQDAVLHPLTLTRLMSWNERVVSALSFVRGIPVVPSCFTEEDDAGKFFYALGEVREWVHKYPDLFMVNGPAIIDWELDSLLDIGLNGAPEDSLLPVERTGAHCLLVHRSVFEETNHDDDGIWFLLNERGTGEDFYFASLARQENIPVYVDMSVVAGHSWGDWPIGAMEFVAFDNLTDWEGKKIYPSRVASRGMTEYDELTKPYVDRFPPLIVPKEKIEPEDTDNSFDAVKKYHMDGGMSEYEAILRAMKTCGYLENNETIKKGVEHGSDE